MCVVYGLRCIRMMCYLFVLLVCVLLVLQNGFTSLYQAAACGQDKVAGLLLQNSADVNAADKVGVLKRGGWLEWQRIRERK